MKVTPTLDKEGKDEVGRIGVYSPVEKTIMGSIKSDLNKRTNGRN